MPCESHILQSPPKEHVKLVLLETARRSLEFKQRQMNLRLYALIALLGTQILAFAAPSERKQRPARPSKELIQKEKKAFLTKELSLTAKEADDLMLIINELDGKRFALWKSCYSMRRRMQSRGGSITDAEYEKYFNQVMDNRVQEAELERTYYTKCKEVIPMHKLVKLERANRAFARQFMQRQHN